MLTIMKPGLLSTIQDLGRFGYQKYGVITSGAMDSLSHRLANLLVGNKESSPTIEITMLGPIIQFQQDSLIAICGGNLTPTIGNKPVRLWRPILVRKGAVLKFGQIQSGCRAYLAVAGGISVPQVLNSTSTYLRAQVGGFKGRTLQAGDVLTVAEYSTQSTKLMKILLQKGTELPLVEANWSISPELIPKIETEALIHVLQGRQTHQFSKEAQDLFLSKAFQISSQSDRMGYRLNGPALKLEKPVEMLSEAVTFGTIQVPQDGNPIILMADRQTTGGYPKIGEVASVDLPRLAQAKPLDTIYFKPISLDDAQQQLLEREKKIKQLKYVIDSLLGGK